MRALEHVFRVERTHEREDAAGMLRDVVPREPQDSPARRDEVVRLCSIAFLRFAAGVEAAAVELDRDLQVAGRRSRSARCLASRVAWSASRSRSFEAAGSRGSREGSRSAARPRCSAPGVPAPCRRRAATGRAAPTVARSPGSRAGSGASHRSAPARAACGSSTTARSRNVRTGRVTGIPSISVTSRSVRWNDSCQTTSGERRRRWRSAVTSTISFGIEGKSQRMPAARCEATAGPARHAAINRCFHV